MTDRKLLKDVRDALKMVPSIEFADIGHVETQRFIGACATTLARVEAALAETEEEKVERVARAMCVAMQQDPDMRHPVTDVAKWEYEAVRARAAIAAMGE